MCHEYGDTDRSKESWSSNINNRHINNRASNHIKQKVTEQPKKKKKTQNDSPQFQGSALNN